MVASFNGLYFAALLCSLCIGKGSNGKSQHLGRTPPATVLVSVNSEHGLIPGQPFTSTPQPSMPPLSLPASFHPTSLPAPMRSHSFYPVISNIDKSRHPHAHLSQVEVGSVMVHDHGYRKPPPGITTPIKPVIFLALQNLQFYNNSKLQNSSDEVNPVKLNHFNIDFHSSKLKIDSQRSLTSKSSSNTLTNVQSNKRNFNSSEIGEFKDQNTNINILTQSYLPEAEESSEEYFSEIDQNSEQENIQLSLTSEIKSEVTPNVLEKQRTIHATINQDVNFGKNIKTKQEDYIRNPEINPSNYITSQHRHPYLYSQYNNFHPFTSSPNPVISPHSVPNSYIPNAHPAYISTTLAPNYANPIFSTHPPYPSNSPYLPHPPHSPYQPHSPHPPDSPHPPHSPYQPHQSYQPYFQEEFPVTPLSHLPSDIYPTIDSNKPGQSGKDKLVSNVDIDHSPNSEYKYLNNYYHNPYSSYFAEQDHVHHKYIDPSIIYNPYNPYYVNDYTPTYPPYLQINKNIYNRPKYFSTDNVNSPNNYDIISPPLFHHKVNTEEANKVPHHGEDMRQLLLLQAAKDMQNNLTKLTHVRRIRRRKVPNLDSNYQSTLSRTFPKDVLSRNHYTFGNYGPNVLFNQENVDPEFISFRNEPPHLPNETVDVRDQLTDLSNPFNSDLHHSSISTSVKPLYKYKDYTINSHISENDSNFNVFHNTTTISPYHIYDNKLINENSPYKYLPDYSIDHNIPKVQTYNAPTVHNYNTPTIQNYNTATEQYYNTATEPNYNTATVQSVTTPTVVYEHELYNVEPYFYPSPDLREIHRSNIFYETQSKNQQSTKLPEFRPIQLGTKQIGNPLENSYSRILSSNSQTLTPGHKISLNNSPSEQQKTNRFPSVKITIPSPALSGLPFFISGHKDLGPFIIKSAY